LPHHLAASETGPLAAAAGDAVKALIFDCQAAQPVIDGRIGVGVVVVGVDVTRIAPRNEGEMEVERKHRALEDARHLIVELHH
jgi:hypothetical protein